MACGRFIQLFNGTDEDIVGGLRDQIIRAWYAALQVRKTSYNSTRFGLIFVPFLLPD